MTKKEVLSKKKEKEERLHRALLREMLKLATSGLGLVAALAWNEVIKEAVSQYIKPLVGGASGIISLLIYAVIVTVLVVSITYSMAKFSKKD